MTINSKELIDLEKCLCGKLAKLLPFSNHALYFPDSGDNRETTLLSEERLLLVPICWQNECLGMLRLEGVNPVKARKLKSFLPEVVSSLLESCLLKRLINEDVNTGLATEEHFFGFMENEADQMASELSDPQISVQDAPLYKLCLGLIVLGWLEGRELAKTWDYGYFEHVYKSMGQALKNILPEKSLSAILGKYEGRLEFGILFNSSGQKSCETLSRNFIEVLSKLEFKDPLTGSPYHPKFFAGHALYPQDMHGDELRLPMREQTIRLRDRARIAMRGAYQRHNSPEENILGFSALIHSGGVILANLGQGRFRINLGKAANARAGMRFKLIGKQDNSWCSKGQLVITESRIMDSIAVIISMEKGCDMPQAGDRLILLSPGSAWQKNERYISNANMDQNFSGPFCNHAEFLERFQDMACKSNGFVFGITRISSGEKDFEITVTIKKILDFLERGKNNSDLPDLLAPFGSDGLVFFINGGNPLNPETFIQNLENIVAEDPIIFQTGLFSWPFLNYSRAESEDCALKALEYASLLPDKKYGFFNSMAITIAADRKFSQGDNYGALEDYRLALLADPENAMARNSMAVCLAALGKFEEAKKSFERALQSASQEDLQGKIHYNLGVVHQKTDDPQLAAQHYRKCLKKDANHVFAWLRLGQLAEEKGSRGRARRYYACAVSKTDLHGPFFNTVQRQLAKFEAGGNSKDQARARLHDNLIRNPEDASSLLELAELYLDKNLDPILAELLAKKSLQIRPGKKGWEVLAAAFLAQGENEKAERARLRAGDFK